MLLGRVESLLDEKGRFVLPASFRDSLHGPLYFALGDEDEIDIWAEDGFNAKLAEKKSKELFSPQDGRAFRRFTTYAAPVKVDGQFRIAIPENLRQKAGLQREVYIAGAFDRIEIWDRAAHDRYLDADEHAEAS